jgi:hypothetical protein
MWGDADRIAWRDKAKQNPPDWIAPAIYTAGPVVDGDPPTWPGSRVITTAEAAVAEVEAENKAGYDFIKVYDSLPRPAYDALAAAAKQAGIRFVGHVPAAAGLAHALEVGQASIEHLTGYLEAAQDATSRLAEMPRGAARRLEIVAHLDETKLAALAKATRDAGVANVPTLVVLDRFGALDHPEALVARPENKYVPPPMLAGWDPKQDFRLKTFTPAAFEAMRTGNRFRAKLVKALADAGATILAGTDTPNPFVVPGFAMHDELALLAGCGLTPYQVMRAATAAPAAWLGDKDIGTIAVGARADLVLLAADPLKDVAATTQRAGVMLRGRWYTQQDLAAKLDAQAASYAHAGDRFATAPPLAIPDGDSVFAASYRSTYAGTEVGRERLAVVRAKDGHRIIVAQASSDPPSAKLATIRLELDAAGTLVSLDVVEDGKHATATIAGGKLHVVADTPSDAPAAADLLLDANLVATMIPFADRAKPGAKIAVAGKSLAGTGKLTPITYTFERTGDKLAFTVRAPFGTVPGSYEVDDKGFPVSITLQAGPSQLVVHRE